MSAAQNEWVPYCGAAPLPAEWLLRWNLDPLLLAILGGAAVWTWVSRGQRGRRENLALGGALALIFLLYVSPICALSSALFSVRVVHHVGLTALVAPLLVMAGVRLIQRTPELLLATGIATFMFWLWHAPGLYVAALSSDAIYWVMQLSLLGSALLFWQSVSAASRPAAIAGLLAMTVQMGLLATLLTFAPQAIYAPHWLTTQAWEFSPLADQQLAGLIMWVPGSIVYLAAALLALRKALREPPAQRQTLC